MRTLLIANRGEIALRILRTARQCGYRTLAVFSDADRAAPHVLAADAAVPIGGRTPQESYLDIDKLVAAAVDGGADCVHPGYGFLSENADFARACAAAGLNFVGPSPDVIELMGNKRRAKEFALQAGVPCIPGYQGSQDPKALSQQALQIGYPLMLKAAAGGGGRGMRVVHDPSEFDAQLQSARAESLAAFGSDEIILEKALGNARHIEIQVFADQFGNCVHLGERDCSVQRRHQKVVEEAPSPAVSPELRDKMGQAAVALAQACHYSGAGTVEFLLDDKNQFYFLEMNTRLQVEHGVTELVTGTDLVAWQLAVSRGEPLPKSQQDIHTRGHAIEVRLYAEDPQQDFLPQSGKILQWQSPPSWHDAPAGAPIPVRFDHALAEGLEVSPFYDPMLGKLMAWGETRDQARWQLARALQDLSLIGPRNNRFFLQQIIADPVFAAGDAHTGFLSQQYTPPLESELGQKYARALGCTLLHHLAIATTDLHRGYANWQSGGGKTPRYYRLDDGSESFAVSLTAAGSHRYSIQLHSGEQITVDLATREPGTHPASKTEFFVNGIQYPAQWHLAGGALYLIFERQQWEFRDVTYSPARTAQPHGSGYICAPMEGNLTQICVAVGAAVSSGDLLGTMEAMKMEHRLQADCDGTVSAIEVMPGTQVKSGQLLIQIQAAPEDTAGEPATSASQKVLT